MPATPSPLTPLTFDARLYRAALRLYPAAFREEFVGQIAGDFDDARGDAATTGRACDLLMFWLMMSRDLTGSLAAQWLRTGWPLIATVAFGVSWLQFTAVTSFWWSNVFPTGVMTDNDEAVLVYMLLAVVFVVIAATITGTIWIGRSLRRPPTRR